jgi:hypothetical protein
MHDLSAIGISFQRGAQHAPHAAPTGVRAACSNFALASAGLCLCTVAALATAACSVPVRPSEPPPGCDAGDQRMVRDTLYFGRNIPGGGTVSDAQWRAFLDEAVTPRFPDGLTLATAIGQWRGASGRIETEATQVVTLLHPGDAASREKVAAIAREYKQRFMQEAVLRERIPACTAF